MQGLYRTKLERNPLLFLEGHVAQYIENSPCHLFFLECGKQLLPFSVTEKAYKNSYVTSNYYIVDHLRAQKKYFWTPILKLMEWALKSVEVNRCVLINNWLLSNALCPSLKPFEVKELLEKLKKKHPKHSFMWRNLNLLTGRETLKCLKDLGFYFFYSREVFLYDPQKKRSKKAAYHYRRDQRLLEQGDFTIKKGDELTDREILNSLKLYEDIYFQKSYASPRYTVSYLKNAIQHKLLEVTALFYKGDLVGVCGWQFNMSEMILPFFGFLACHEKSQEIYRLLLHLSICEADKREVLFNDGDGGGCAKTNRGFEPIKEYCALYTKHLPLYKKAFWFLGAMFSQGPIL